MLPSIFNDPINLVLFFIQNYCIYGLLVTSKKYKKIVETEEEVTIDKIDKILFTSVFMTSLIPLSILIPINYIMVAIKSKKNINLEEPMIGLLKIVNVVARTIVVCYGFIFIIIIVSIIHLIFDIFNFIKKVLK